MVAEILVSPVTIVLIGAIAVIALAYKAKKGAEMVGILSSTAAGFMIGLISWSPVSIGLAIMGAVAGFLVSVAVISMVYVWRRPSK
jgi:hypothetical protein